jgi:hypothetical protein
MHFFISVESKEQQKKKPFLLATKPLTTCTCRKDFVAEALRILFSVFLFERKMSHFTRASPKTKTFKSLKNDNKFSF